MKTRITTILCLLIFPALLFSQELYQYFDGADTLENSAIFIDIDSSSSTIWQIGVPQKSNFNSAATLPNALLTDTVNYIPTNDTASFQYHLHPGFTWGVWAIQWKQKIDLDYGKDGGLIEFSVDGGNTWESAFDNPYVYSFFGFDENNVGTLATGEKVFTGVDNAWRDIWLCYDMSWANGNDALMMRHTIICDSIDNNNEGWMIDNLLAHFTWVHTLQEVEQKEYIKVTPNPTSGRVHISARKINEYHIIEQMELLDANGRVLESWESIPVQFFIDIDQYPNGIYYLNIKTNKESEIVKIVLQK